MRCSACLADKAPDEFTNSQKKRPAGWRKCSACVATATRVAGGYALWEATAVAATSVEPRMQQPPIGEPKRTGNSSAPGSAAAEPGASAAPPTAARLCARAWCGKALSGDPVLRKRCERCKQALRPNLLEEALAGGRAP